jgi:CDP-glucose 4,6-dehydratase
MLQNSFASKTVLVTGHTGFKGAWLVSWLKQLGANVIGVALDPPSEPSHFSAASLSEGIVDIRGNICDYKALENAVISANPDYVFHLAAQALVGDSYRDPLGTWQTNLMGTLNLLEALRKLHKACSAVIITSDKCYNNVEWVWGYRETDVLGGSDPYSASKGAAELAIRSYIKSFFPKDSKVRVASARAGNVIGGGDWAKDRIIPDCIKAWSVGNEVDLRNPQSTRPWQHVLEPLSGYLTLAINLLEQPDLQGESFNFGPQPQSDNTVLNLVQEMSRHWDRVRWRDASHLSELPYESNLLRLNCDKALHLLEWHAALDFKATVRMTAEWYRSYYHEPFNIASVTDKQILAYTAFAKDVGLKWAQ